MLKRAKEKAEKAAAAVVEKKTELERSHGGSAGGVEVEHVGHGGERVSKQQVAAVAEPAEPVGPAFPTLGVTLDFLERFVSEKVAGKPSRYCIAKVDCIGNDADDELSFKAGEILGIGELTAVNDGWLLGYRRAGNWADR